MLRFHSRWSIIFLMKKTLIFFLLFGMLLFPLSGFAADEDYEGYFKEWGRAEGRGFLGVLTFPAEWVTTFAEEMELHTRLWWLTGFPRAIMNNVVRLVSVTHDIVLSPFILPLTKDNTPLTRYFDRPDYPWQSE